MLFEARFYGADVAPGVAAGAAVVEDAEAAVFPFKDTVLVLALTFVPPSVGPGETVPVCVTIRDNISIHDKRRKRTQAG